MAKKRCIVAKNDNDTEVFLGHIRAMKPTVMHRYLTSGLLNTTDEFRSIIGGILTRMRSRILENPQRADGVITTLSELILTDESWRDFRRLSNTVGREEIARIFRNAVDALSSNTSETVRTLLAG